MKNIILTLLLVGIYFLNKGGCDSDHSPIVVDTSGACERYATCLKYNKFSPFNYRTFRWINIQHINGVKGDLGSISACSSILQAGYGCELGERQLAIMEKVYEIKVAGTTFIEEMKDCLSAIHRQLLHCVVPDDVKNRHFFTCMAEEAGKSEYCPKDAAEKIPKFAKIMEDRTYWYNEATQIFGPYDL